MRRTAGLGEKWHYLQRLEAIAVIMMLGIYSHDLLGVLFVVGLSQLVEGQYEDVRCKCVCPSVTNSNGTTSARKIFVKSFREPSYCKCENVVDSAIQESQYHFCERCDCQWQRRNTTTIKVVVIFIICVVSLLFLYMVFLLCLDPLMSYRRTAAPYVEQHNEVNINDDVCTNARTLEADDGTSSVFSRVRHKVRNMAGEQERWKDTVQEQRRHIYDRHTMLN